MRNKGSAVVIAVTVLFFAIGGIAVSLAGCDKTKENGRSESVGYGIAEPNGGAVPDKGVIEIKEKMFMTQVSDVYMNAEDYLGKTIKLEGIFLKEEWEEDTYCFVIRYGPGCCGDDGGNVGFEVKWPEDRMEADSTGAYPDTNSWVAATGVLKVNNQYLYLDLTSLDVLSRRGVEIVRQ
jgi:uncharacterized membrane protein YcgQ (UPF0703/DUF1980 family)